jgi:succinyl-diaminopimelate desuccinylase
LGSDARFWQYAGVPAVIYGPKDFKIGGADEYILEKEFGQLLKVYAYSVIDYLC